MLTAAPSFLSNDGNPKLEFDLASMHAANDGLHGEYSTGQARVQIMVLPEGHPKQQLAALVPLDADGLSRIDAVKRLWRDLHKRPAQEKDPLTSQQRLRLRRMLQAIDERDAGASYRDIASTLFGASRIAAEAWKTSALRGTTIRLVRDGRAMVDGGYRNLLKRRE